MFFCFHYRAPLPPVSISTYALPTPSPSPPWDRGLNQLQHISSTPPPPAANTPLLTSSSAPATMAQLVNQQMVILPAGANPNGKDSRWLTLEVCREFQRSKCSRSDNECKFAHPPAHVEVQNGRVVACFDSIKGKCQRKDPPCKYLHPPQHLREQLLQNGRNNLILKNLQLQAYQQAQYGVIPVAGPKTVAVPTVMPGQYSYLAHPGSSQAHPQAILRPPTLQQAGAATPSPYDATHYPGLQTLSAVPTQPQTTGYNPFITMQTSGDPNSVMSQGLPPNMIPANAKAVRADKFEGGEDTARMWYGPWWAHHAGPHTETTSENGESVTSHASLMDTFSFPTYIPQVCREFQRGTCSRATSECRYAHPADHIVVDATDNHVTVCMDFIKSKCTRDLCKYFHPPSHLQALVRAAHARSQAAALVSNNSTANSSALQTTMPGMIPAYKRIAMADISKGGIPVYQTNQLMSPLQHASLMQLQQPASYIPMAYTTYLYPQEAAMTQMAPTVLAPQMSPLGPALVPSTSPSTTANSAVSATSAVTSVAVTTPSNSGRSILSTPSGLNLYTPANSSSSPSGVARLPTAPNNAYYVEYFGNNKQLRDTLPVCQDFKSGQCSGPYCKQVHLSEDYVEVNNGHVTVCRDYATRQSCKRSRCKYYHIPIDLPPS
ncbi:unnamed protein product [Lymnaea stagnalis]|uniref:C3H1-type domain-containing protein n=1 Tax=Lymnaea stagnalis TaxID=6523 RepID=A0AAV2H502_LYMST